MATKLMFDPPFRRGETLRCEMTLEDGEGNALTGIPTEEYVLRSYLTRKDGGPEMINLQPYWDGDKVVINFVTADLVEGMWYFDIQIRLPDGSDIYTETFQLPVDEPQTKPQPPAEEP